jgi:hypothetical protein
MATDTLTRLVLWGLLCVASGIATAFAYTVIVALHDEAGARRQFRG